MASSLNAATTNALPSAEQDIAVQYLLGAEVRVQDSPELVEI
jgi:hypothetical protein